MNHIDKLDFSLIRYAVLKASELKNKKKVIFGGRKNFNLLKYHKKIDKEKYWVKYRKEKCIFLRGAKDDSHGNRKAELDIIDNNSVILKLDRDTHVEVKLPNLNKKHQQHLTHLQDLCDKKEAGFSLEVNNEYISILFEEEILQKLPKVKVIKNRILSVDLNPNYIGLSIIDWKSKSEKVLIHKEIIDLKQINDLKQDDYKKNKRDNETSMINAHIIELARHYRVELVGFELLGMKSKNHNKGVYINRLLNNDWNKRKVINNLRKRCVIASIKFVEIPAAYSSFIGQMTNENDYDSVAASIELSRRAFLLNLSKKKSFHSIIYPRFDKKNLPTRWKKMVEEKLIGTWKGLYDEIKKSGARYRFLFFLDEFKGVSFSLKSPRSLVWIREPDFVRFS
jgi:hypothetical protein